MPFESFAENTIREYGWAAIGTVDGNHLPFTYTIGCISKYNHPEILIVGMDQKIARSLMRNILELV